MNSPPVPPGMTAIQNIVDNIIVTRVNGYTFFNGEESPYAAVLKVEPDLKNLPFSKRLTLTTFIWTLLAVKPIRTPSTFIYSFFRDETYCEMSVINDRTGDIVALHDGTELIDCGAMKDEFDIKGLKLYLTDTGVITAEDKIIFRDFHEFR